MHKFLSVLLKFFAKEKKNFLTVDLILTADKQYALYKKGLVPLPDRPEITTEVMAMADKKYKHYKQGQL